MAEPVDRPTTRTRLESADLTAAWEQNAADFIAFARGPDEHFGTYHRDLFLELLPPPGTRTLDLGCGEGRLSRHLKSLGHDVVGVDASPTMLAAAHDADPEFETHLADVAALPLAANTVDVVVAFMSLQDVENLDGAVAEASRVLRPGGCFCLAVVHPLASAGEFESTKVDSPFTIADSYLQPSYYADRIARDGRRARADVGQRPPPPAGVHGRADRGRLRHRAPARDRPTRPRDHARAQPPLAAATALPAPARSEAVAALASCVRPRWRDRPRKPHRGARAGAGRARRARAAARARA